MLPRLAFTIFALVADVSLGTIIPRATGACTTPAVRKEWRELTDAEKAEYLRAAVCLRQLPKAKYANIDAARTRLDDLVYTHFALNTEIHFVANFLPWHRWYVQLHEDLMRSECGFTGTQPYWDWTIDADAKNVLNSPVFDPVTGFGGNGKLTGSSEPGFERCVVDGPFANTNLTLGMGLPYSPEHFDRLHCFTRGFNGGEGIDANGELIIGDMQAGAYNSGVMNIIYAFHTFASMGSMLEGLPHAQSSCFLYPTHHRTTLTQIIVHSVIFGDMGPATSPNEPLFFLHHGNVDRVWAKVSPFFLSFLFPRRRVQLLTPTTVARPE
jgi:tyrosinase